MEPTSQPQELARWVDFSAALVEGAGVIVIVLGVLVALGVALWRRPATMSLYAAYRQYFGAAILLGLELLVAADIIRTVSHMPSLREVGVLGAIVLIRTFLSFTLAVELDGRWPWQRPQKHG